MMLHVLLLRHQMFDENNSFAQTVVCRSLLRPLNPYLSHYINMSLCTTEIACERMCEIYNIIVVS